MEVKFKPVAGKEDQAGGVIWRAKDADMNQKETQMTTWFYYAVGAAVVYGLHQIFTKMAADKN